MTVLKNHSIRKLTNALRGSNLKNRAFQGALWTVGGQATGMTLRLGSNLILTRLLFPEVFGMMALVQIFLSGLELFSDIGLHTSIIRSDRSNDPVFLNTAWTLHILRGVILWLFACAIASPAAWFYDEPLLVTLLPVAGLTALISGFRPSRIHTANRDLVLGRLTMIGLASQVIGIAAMVLLAWIFESVWALVIGMLLSNIASLLLFWTVLPGRRDQLQIERAAVWELINFGKWIFVSSACSFLINHADRAILGKFISLDMLGIYSIGFFMASVPLLLGRKLASKIVFPLYKQRPTWESVENQHKIFRMRRWLTGALLAMSFVLAMAGDLLVSVLYDERYRLAGPILVLMVISQLPTAILISYDQILLAAGDSKSFMSRVLFNAIAQTALVFFGIMQLGLTGAILAPGLAAILAYPILIIAVRRYDGWDWRHDLVYGAIALLIAMGGIWVNHAAIADLIGQTAL